MGWVEFVHTKFGRRTKSHSPSNTSVQHEQPDLDDEASTGTILYVPRDEGLELAGNLPLTLPLEVLNLVVRELTAEDDRETLKAIRLANCFLCRQITPILFESIHLSPNLMSLERLQAIAAHCHLAQHVHCLVLHKGTWALNTDEASESHMHILRSFDDSPNDRPKWGLDRRGRFVLSPSINPVELELLNKNFIVEIRKQWVPRDSWLTDLKTLLADETLPTLRKIYVPSWPDHALSEYHIRRTGRVQTLKTSRPFDLRFIMDTMLYTNLRTLDLQDLFIDAFFAFREAHHRSLPIAPLGKLAVLRLRLCERDLNESFSFDWTYVLRVSLSSLHHFLEACAPSLKELSFRIGPGSLSSERPLVGNHRLEQIQTTEVVTATSYPQLRRLELIDFAISEEGFLGFLSRHNPLLKRLSITNWVMPVIICPINSWVKISHSSLIRAIWKIPQLTKLDQAHLTGDFITSNEEGLDSPCGWRAKQCSHMMPYPHHKTGHDFPENIQDQDRVQKYSIRTQIELYLTRRSDFPFSDSLSRRLEADDYEDLEDTFKTHLKAPRNGASQWTWTLDALPDVVSGERQDSSWHSFDRRIVAEQSGSGSRTAERVPEVWSSWYRIRR